MKSFIKTKINQTNLKINDMKNYGRDLENKFTWMKHINFNIHVRKELDLKNQNNFVW